MERRIIYTPSVSLAGHQSFSLLLGRLLAVTRLAVGTSSADTPSGVSSSCHSPFCLHLYKWTNHVLLQDA